MAVGCVLRTGKSSAAGEEGAWDAAGGESRQRLRGQNRMGLMEELACDWQDWPLPKALERGNVRD